MTPCGKRLPHRVSIHSPKGFGARRPEIRISPNTTRSEAAVVQDCRTMIEAVEPNIAIRGIEPLSGLL